MDGYNLFEPDLELDINTIPYEDMGIQGVWPRKQRTPSDVFPANANLVARGDNNKARWCKADEDGVLYTHDIGGGGGSSTVTPTQHSNNVSGGTFAGSEFIDFLPKMAEIYGLTCGAYIDQGIYTDSIVRNWWLAICEYGNESNRYILAMGQVGEDPSGNHMPMGNGSVNIRFNPPVVPPQLNPDNGFAVVFICPVNDWEMWYSIDYLPG